MLEKTIDGEVGRVKMAANVFLCFEFTSECYQIMLSLSMEV